MAGNANGNERLREFKAQLVKTSRMYAMCEKAGVAEPMDVTGMAVAAFEDMTLREALVFVRTNEQNIKDLAWAFANSGSAAEFEKGSGRSKPSPNAADQTGSWKIEARRANLRDGTGRV